MDTFKKYSVLFVIGTRKKHLSKLLFYSELTETRLDS